MQQQGVLLRIKRRRDHQAPEQIVLEATSRTSALLTDFQRSLGISGDVEAIAAAADIAGPPKKRCRFVLLKPAVQAAASEQQQQQQVAVHADQQPTAATAAEQYAAGETTQTSSQPPAAAAAGAAADAARLGSRVLDLWHSSGVTYTPTAATAAGGSGSKSRDMGGRTKHAEGLLAQQQHDTAAAAGGSGQPASRNPEHELEKGAMYEDMVHEYLQQQAPAPPSQPARKPSSRRAARSQAHTSPAADTPSLSGLEPQQQQHQQQTAGLPEYLTREMLQQYGLLAQAHQQPPLAAAAVAHSSPSPGIESSEDPEYVYDMYVPVYDDTDMTDAEQLQQQQQGDEPAGLPTVVRLWEEDLADFDDLWPVTAGAANAAAGDDSEDSNAEDYHANDYPDEEDSYRSGDTDNDFNPHHQSSSEEFADEQTNEHRNSLITCYKPELNPRAQHVGVNDGVDSEEFDVDDYESSGDEEQLQGWYNSGAAWRAVLAKEVGMLQQDEEMEDM